MAHLLLLLFVEVVELANDGLGLADAGHSRLVRVAHLDSQRTHAVQIAHVEVDGGRVEYVIAAVVVELEQLVGTLGLVRVHKVTLTVVAINTYMHTKE